MLHTLLPEGYTISRTYQVLMKHFWPGPLTLLFPKNDTVSNLVTAGQATVAVRMPEHPVARALIAIANTPLAAPSANSSGKPSPTRAEHVLKGLNGKLSVILDGGACGVGLESTVVDGLQEDGNLRILRPGGVTVEDIESVLQEELRGFSAIPRVLVHRRDYTDESLEVAPTTPGMKYRHYSPTAPVTLLLTRTRPPSNTETVSLTAFLKSLQERHKLSSKEPMRIGVLATTDSKLWDHLFHDSRLEWDRYPLGPSTVPSTIARHLFDGLFTLDQKNVHHIIIEEVNEAKEGLAIMNRVRKAASESKWISFTGATMEF
ncbi:hypothetical protein AX17_001294 [Amanita inopinata Kibby_2008]|nr:hypothetical protein AX17_001294 [Amanita inopinata Kibby_2008]